MKFIYSLVAILALSFAGLSQKGVHLKYETKIDATGEEADMMAMMMNGSTMELAFNSERTYMKTQIGTMMTMEMQFQVESEEMTMFMSGMMGSMAFQGNANELGDGEDEEAEKPEIELVNETKQILGVKCKKAILKDAEGNESVYWYTEDFKRPEGMDKMPSDIPGLCLQFQQASEEMTITYTAIEFEDKVEIDDYKLVIPDGVDIQSLEDLQNMGMGGM